jgi:hypothetical protein
LAKHDQELEHGDDLLHDVDDEHGSQDFFLTRARMTPGGENRAGLQADVIKDLAQNCG